MKKENPVRPILPLLVLMLAPLACSKDPSQPREPAPVSAAAGAAEPAEVPADELSAPSILLAQVGHELGPAGLLADSAASIPAGKQIHGLAVFRGPEGASGEVSLQIFASDESLVYSESRPFTLTDGASVGFQVPNSQRPAAGEYRALFLCDGGPCWEIRFTVE
jgi:hypothetical protein